MPEVPRLALLVAASLCATLLLVAGLNRSSLFETNGAPALMLPALLVHTFWLWPYVAAAGAVGARYRTASVRRRLAVLAARSFLLFCVGTAWSTSLFAVADVGKNWALLAQRTSFEVLCRIVTRLASPIPYAWVMASAVLATGLFGPSAWLRAGRAAPDPSHHGA